jgi:hypothetical protein
LASSAAGAAPTIITVAIAAIAVALVELRNAMIILPSRDRIFSIIGAPKSRNTKYYIPPALRRERATNETFTSLVFAASHQSGSGAEAGARSQEATSRLRFMAHKSGDAVLIRSDTEASVLFAVLVPRY